MRDMHTRQISSFTDGSAAKILIDGSEAEILIECVRVTRVKADACVVGCGMVEMMMVEVVRKLRMAGVRGGTVETMVKGMRKIKWT